MLVRVSTIGYLLGAFWTLDERYVAVNNRRGNSGDYLWVFSLRTGQVIKGPDDIGPVGKQLDSDALTRAIVEKVTSQLPELTLKTFLRRTTIAKCWLTNNQLKVDTSLLFANGNGVWVMLTEIYEVGEHEFRLRGSRITTQIPPN
jgi:hypothetical protein